MKDGQYRKQDLTAIFLCAWPPLGCFLLCSVMLALGGGSKKWLMKETVLSCTWHSSRPGTELVPQPVVQVCSSLQAVWVAFVTPPECCGCFCPAALGKLL